MFHSPFSWVRSSGAQPACCWYFLLCLRLQLFSVSIGLSHWERVLFHTRSRPCCFVVVCCYSLLCLRLQLFSVSIGLSLREIVHGLVSSFVKGPKCKFLPLILKKLSPKQVTTRYEHERLPLPIPIKVQFELMLIVFSVRVSANLSKQAIGIVRND